jgi:hypothetical protein
VSRALHLTPAQRRIATGGRTLLQPPPPGMSLDGTRLPSSQGIPGDVLFALAALSDLADQGNLIARQLYEHERERLGITRGRIFGPQ